MTDPNETLIENQVDAGLEEGAGLDRSALDQLFDSAYPELRRMAHQRLYRASAITSLDTTGLVHECYLRLAKPGGLRAEDRAYLMGCAARAMRCIIIDLLRRRSAVRHGGDTLKVTLDPEQDLVLTEESEALRVSEALQELEQLDARLARVVEMKYFAGMEFSEIAAALSVSERTAQRDWQKARLWLDVALRG